MNLSHFITMGQLYDDKSFHNNTDIPTKFTCEDSVIQEVNGLSLQQTKVRTGTRLPVQIPFTGLYCLWKEH